MRFSLPPLLALPLFTVAAWTGCSSAEDGSFAGQESNFTSEAGGDASAPETDANAPADVAPFSVTDATGKPKLRFAYGGAAAVEAHEPEWTTVLSGSDRRFRLRGATPVAGGKPVFYVEFGRGAAFIEKGTYDCAAMQAVVLVVETDGTKKLTVVDGGAQRACKVVIDEVVDVEATTGVPPRSFRKVAGHIEASVGDRTNAASETIRVAATFAATVFEN